MVPLRGGSNVSETRKLNLKSDVTMISCEVRHELPPAVFRRSYFMSLRAARRPTDATAQRNRRPSSYPILGCDG